MKKLLVVFAFGAAGLLTGCGETQPRSVPNVTGEQLNVAEDRLDATGLSYSTSGGGAFGIVLRSNWTVCRQSPGPRHVASSVLLSVARSCSIPNVEDESLDDAEDTLRESGIPYSAQSLDGDSIIVESLWTVCSQSPLGGTPIRQVQLFVSHDCYEEGGSW